MSAVDHEARSNAALAQHRMDAHEKACGERMARIETMFHRLTTSQDKLWEAVDDIRANAKSEGIAGRDRSISTLKWAAGLLAAGLIATVGWLLLH